MGNRVVLILIVLALAAGAGSLYLLRGEGESSSNARALGQVLFPQLKAAEVERITVQDAKGTINLERKGAGWAIAERGGFPADIERVGELVVKLLELKTGQTEPIGEKDRARMQLAAPGKGDGAATLVTFKGKDGKTLAELLVGKKYFKSPPEGDATKALGDGRYVMLPAEPARVILVSDPLKQAQSSAEEWVARDGFAVENIRSLEVKLADGGYRLARENLDANWVLDGKGGELDGARANAATFALAKVEVADVAAQGADTGIADGPQITATTTDGLEYRIRLGKLEKDRYFAQVAVEGTPARVVKPAPAPPDEKADAKEKREKAAADEAKRFTERVAREKALSGFTLLVPKGKLEDVLKKRDDMLKKEEKKDEKKK
ncbi:MAG: DUF4340 domain-containing protein [Burkholderiales bacterium]|nr:DUF4340 domain-containing protein [Burkholderiales bacterium]